MPDCHPFSGWVSSFIVARQYNLSPFLLLTGSAPKAAASKDENSLADDEHGEEEDEEQLEVEEEDEAK